MELSKKSLEEAKKFLIKYQEAYSKGINNVDDMPSACYLCSNSASMWYSWTKNVSGTCVLQSDITNKEDCEEKNNSLKR